MKEGVCAMANEQLLRVASDRAYEMAYRLASLEQCSIEEVVERALELYSNRSPNNEPASQFYARLTRIAAWGPDIDLDALIRADNKPHEGIDLLDPSDI
jgi:hypothetical protein